MKKSRLFVDMDGVLAEYELDAYIGENPSWKQPGYFLGLKPQPSVLEAVKMIINSKKVDVYVLSAVDGIGAINDKLKWLSHYLPELKKENCLFPANGVPKSTIILGGVSKTDVLLDDRTKNLHLWEESGGTGIKLFNDINKGRTWKGFSVSYDSDAPSLYKSILNKVVSIKKEVNKGYVQEI